MQGMDDTLQRGKKWQLMTGIISYLDNSLVILTMDELRTAMEAKRLEFDAELVTAMVNNGNIGCLEAFNDKAQPSRYFCSTKYKQVRSIS